jgi:hypothetical protein
MALSLFIVRQHIALVVLLSRLHIVFSEEPTDSIVMKVITYLEQQGSDLVLDSVPGKRRLGGSSSGGSSSGGSSSSRRREQPKEYRTVRSAYATCPSVAVPATCQPVFNAQASGSQSYVRTVNGVEDTNEETNFDNARFGHAKYECIQPLLEAGQFDKAISYAWCVEPHCAEKCPGVDCPTNVKGVDINDPDKCKSAVFNYLGYAKRKHTVPDLAKAEEYYNKALTLWPGNCGAQAYRSELELQKSQQTSARKMLNAACSSCAVGSDCALKAAVDLFIKGGVQLSDQCLHVRNELVKPSTSGQPARRRLGGVVVAVFLTKFTIYFA